MWLITTFIIASSLDARTTATYNTQQQLVLGFYSIYFSYLAYCDFKPSSHISFKKKN